MGKTIAIEVGNKYESRRHEGVYGVVVKVADKVSLRMEDGNVFDFTVNTLKRWWEFVGKEVVKTTPKKPTKKADDNKAKDKDGDAILDYIIKKATEIGAEVLNPGGDNKYCAFKVGNKRFAYCTYSTRKVVLSVADDAVAITPDRKIAHKYNNAYDLKVFDEATKATITTILQAAYNTINS